MANIVRRALWLSLLAGLFATAPHTASAQKYPDRPVRIIIPLGPGGVGDK
jgi:tripartite-type tricarboxylate transporter receptor subunit TctC